MNCPKCGSENSMRGPKYVSDEKGERLVTKCRVCKYTETKSCADAKVLTVANGRVKIEMPAGEDPQVKG